MTIEQMLINITERIEKQEKMIEQLLYGNRTDGAYLATLPVAEAKRILKERRQSK